MKLVTERSPDLPRLGWIARLDISSGVVRALVGRSVETGEDFVAEGVWPGAFDAPLGMTLEGFFGSGLVVREGSVLLCPSRALVDRVFSVRIPSGWIASNSLLLLLGTTGATLTKGRSYLPETYTVLRGIEGYDPVMPVDGLEALEQHYFFPVRLGEVGRERLDVPMPPPFATFEAYEAHLDAAVSGLVANAHDPARSRGPLRILSSLSRGYDSPAVTALLRRHCRPIAYTAARSNSLIPGWMSREAAVDDGTPIAEELGVEIRHLTTASATVDERFFYAGGAGDTELVYRSLAGDVAADPQPSALFTGYHGKVWDRWLPERTLNPDLVRWDVSGLSLSEARLEVGFVHCALPFLGARRSTDIHSISVSPEMAPWSVGGSYDRPIPRRIVESAGIPRRLVGQRKRAVLQKLSVPEDEHWRREFGEWLRLNRGMTLTSYRLRVWAGLARWAVLRVGQKILTALGAKLPEPDRWRWVPAREPMAHLHPWAVESLVVERRRADATPQD